MDATHLLWALALGALASVSLPLGSAVGLAWRRGSPRRSEFELLAGALGRPSGRRPRRAKPKAG